MESMRFSVLWILEMLGLLSAGLLELRADGLLRFVVFVVLAYRGRVFGGGVKNRTGGYLNYSRDYISFAL